MMHPTTDYANHMGRELKQSAQAFQNAASLDVKDSIADLSIFGVNAIYTIARGSSDAAANIISYEWMRELGIPVTSLPPSVFSVGQGVDMTGALGVIVSQSGGSQDLCRAAQGIVKNGGRTLAITNVEGSPLENAAQVTIPMGAGPELAVPATKSVIASIGAGLAILAALKSDYATRLAKSIAAFEKVENLPLSQHAALRAAMLRTRHIYIVGRDTGFGAAQEIALKIKETCAIHAEAYSASEVLHGPMQLATNALTVFILDTNAPGTEDSLNTAEQKFREIGADVHRIAPSVGGLTPAAAAAALLRHIYPIIQETALALGHDPDAPQPFPRLLLPYEKSDHVSQLGHLVRNSGTTCNLARMGQDV